MKNQLQDMKTELEALQKLVSSPEKDNMIKQLKNELHLTQKQAKKKIERLNEEIEKEQETI